MVTPEEALKFIKEHIDNVSSQSSLPRVTQCLECDSPKGRHGGWGRCLKHYNKKRRQVIKEACVELLGGACAKCGGRFPPPMFDFHHRYDKTTDVSLAFRRQSLVSIAEEVAKCVLLCANCHRMEHSNDYF